MANSFWDILLTMLKHWNFERAIFSQKKRGIRGTFLWNHFEIRPLAKEMSFNVFFSVFLLWWQFCSSEWNYFSKGLEEKHFCEITLKSGHWPRRRCLLKFFFFQFLALAAIFSAKRSRFSNFGRGSLEEHFCANIFKSGHWSRMRYCLRFSICSSGGHLVQWSGTIAVISEFRSTKF